MAKRLLQSQGAGVEGSVSGRAATSARPSGLEACIPLSAPRNGVGPGTISSTLEKIAWGGATPKDRAGDLKDLRWSRSPFACGAAQLPAARSARPFWEARRLQPSTPGADNEPSPGIPETTTTPPEDRHR